MTERCQASWQRLVCPFGAILAAQAIPLFLTPLPTPAQTVPIAQQVPPPTLRDLVPRPSPSPLPAPSPAPLPPLDQLLPPTPTPGGTQESPTGDVPATIVVKQFKVTGSTVFSEAELAAETKDYINQPITLTQLFEARSKITDLYIRRGYITSGAYIPPQRLQDGVVEIRVVEGRLEDIRVTGNRRLNPNYVRSRLAIATRPPLNRNQLLEALQLLQLNPLIQNISAELSAGTRPGLSLLEVRVTEADTFSGQIGLDNGRSPSVGTVRRQFQLNETNLLGLGDGLSIAFTNTNGSNAFDATYSLPVNARNGTVSFSSGFSFSDVIEQPFDVLNIKARSTYYELSFRQPVLQNPNREFALGLTGSYRSSKATLNPFDLGEIPFPALGSDTEGRTRVFALRFFQEWTQRSGQSVFAARSQFSVGLGAFDATINEEPPDSRFFAWRGQAQWVRLLAPDTLLLVRGDLQLADRALVPVEQFGLGGLQSIRGYRQDALLTDNGIFGSVEVRIPIARLPQLQGLVQLTPFIDVGSGWNLSGRADPDPQTLASVGLGLRLQLGNSLNARLDWGIPLVSIDGEKRSLQEQGVYFSIFYSPF